MMSLADGLLKFSPDVRGLGYDIFWMAHGSVQPRCLASPAALTVNTGLY